MWYEIADSTPASMGPLIFISGNSEESLATLLTGTRFNGATDFHQWKWANNLGGVTLQQWASMGPLIFISGNSDRRLSYTELLECFNGATDFHQWK